jgi:hypothetical protein
MGSVTPRNVVRDIERLENFTQTAGEFFENLWTVIETPVKGERTLRGEPPGR